MKKSISTIIFTLPFIFSAVAQSPKLISDCTVIFNVSVNDATADPKTATAMMGATKVVYIKGSKSRSDLITQSFKQTTIYDNKTDSTVILREFGNAKYLSFLNDAKRSKQNARFVGLSLISTNETKTILGYECKKVLAKFSDGSTYNIFYTTSMVCSNQDYEYTFKDLPGFVLEYESEAESGKLRVTYSATKITLTPVPSAKFDIPKSGYRII